MGASTDFLYADIMKHVADTGGLDDQYALMDNISRTMGAGAEYSRYSDIFYGINRLPGLAPLPIHRESQGLVLFTRPHLNLSYDNISNVRTLAALMTQDPSTYQYAVRMMLDPITYGSGAKPSPLVDRYNPYITLLTNTISTMSAPPDIGLNTYVSPEGARKESWMMNDSIAEYNGKYDITCTFNNPKGNPVLAMLHAWIIYISGLRVGPLVPHPQQRIQNEMDYFTRIERYKLDVTGRKVEQWFHTGASFPTNLSIGAGFGFNREEALEYENKQISVQFASVGAVYNDPIQIIEFNERIQRYNSGMADAVRSQKYKKIPNQYLVATNYNGYPRIEPATMELEWWLDDATYTQLTKGL
jgi:hypothetical protein